MKIVSDDGMWMIETVNLVDAPRNPDPRVRQGAATMPTGPGEWFRVSLFAGRRWYDHAHVRTVAELEAMFDLRCFHEVR